LMRQRQFPKLWILTPFPYGWWREIFNVYIESSVITYKHKVKALYYKLCSPNYVNLTAVPHSCVKTVSPSALFRTRIIQNTNVQRTNVQTSCIKVRTVLSCNSIWKIIWFYSNVCKRWGNQYSPPVIVCASLIWCLRPKNQTRTTNHCSGQNTVWFGL
jgi:hypothetical protein